jgi:UDP-GlcNAc:undecaprenyl-phosphate GlcNAc-1-phosphate transferase
MMDAMGTKAAVFFISAFVLTASLTPLVRWVALRRGWVAHPKSDRWHQTPTALMGGIAIFVGLAIPLLFLLDFSSLATSLVKNHFVPDEVFLTAGLLLGTAFLFGLGLLDDFRSLKPQTKLLGQIVVAVIMTFLGFRLQWFESLTLDTMATLFWIVGITNAFNLIDNMDGLCAGVGLVAALSLAVLFSPSASAPFWMALALSGALAGFLIYNFKPAKIFMGDCGSLVIGFCLSGLTLYLPESLKVNRLAGIAVPILVLMVPILDTTLVTTVRLLSGRKASTGGRDHTSHRLVLMGFSEKKAVLFLYAVGAVSGIAGIFSSRSDTITSPAVIVPMIVAIGLMGIYLSQLRVYPEGEFSSLRDRSFTPVLIELTYKRHVLLVLLDFILVSFSYYLSYRLRFDGQEFSFYFKIFLKSLPVVIGCKLIVFYLIGIYQGMWRFLSTNDVFLYLRASFIASVVSIAAVTFIYRFTDFSKGLFLIDWILTSGLLLIARGSFRMFVEIQKRKSLSGDKVIIYGAGRGGELLLREILNNAQLKVKPIGFIDDDRLMIGKKIQNVPIVGDGSQLEKVFQKEAFTGILISFQQTDPKSNMAYVAAKDFCRRKNLFLKSFKIGLQDIALEE